MVNDNGCIVPSTEDLNQAISMLLNGIQNDEKVNVHFRVSPVDYFRAIGIATDGIPEIMRELGLSGEAAYAAGCSWTCWVTCFDTCVFTGSSASAITLKATANPLRQG